MIKIYTTIFFILLQAASISANNANYFTTDDNAKIYYREWSPDTKPRAVVIIIHGIGFESEPYQMLGVALNPYGVAVYGIDLRGHGLSDGERGMLSPAACHSEDITEFIKILRKKYPDIPVFLSGDSMGGLIALHTAKNSSNYIDGLILISPAISPNPKQFIGPELPLLAIISLFNWKARMISIVDNRLDISSRDKAFVTLRRSDEKAQKSVSLQYILQISRDSNNWQKRIAPHIKIPILILNGSRDNVVLSSSGKMLYNLVGSKDKTKKLYQGAYHTLLWDDMSDEVLNDIKRWVLKHIE